MHISVSYETVGLKFNSFYKDILFETFNNDFNFIYTCLILHYAILAKAIKLARLL